MVSQDIIAQLRQDITTASDAGDDATADRLRAELSKAVEQPDDYSADRGK
jgi:DNA-binding ferritin-like protein